MTITKDPTFRYYNCNLQAPKIKCSTITIDKIEGGLKYGSTGVVTLTGLFSTNTTFVLNTTNFLPLNKKNFVGELSLYVMLPDKSGGVIQVAIVRYDNVTQYVNVYQQTGNVTISASTFQNTITFTSSTLVSCSWFYRGTY